MTPELLAQHLAHKARQHRFAVAAMRANPRSRHVPVEQHCIIMAPAPDPVIAVRREYETQVATIANAPITWRILSAVSAEFGIPVRQITSSRRHKKYTLPRFVIIGLMLDLTKMSLPAIGRRLGGRDHTTIISGRNRINTLLQGEAFRNRFDQIKAALQ